MVSAYATGAWARARKWIRRNRLLSASLTVAILSLAGGSVAVAIQNATISGNLKTIAREKATAEKKSSEVLSLSAMQDLASLTERAEELWPPFPKNIAKYEEWLADAEVLVSGRAADPSRNIGAYLSVQEHEENLRTIGSRSRARTPEQVEQDRLRSPSYRHWREESERLTSTRRLMSEADPTTVEAALRHDTQKLDALERQIDREQNPTFDDDGDRWWYAQLSTLVQELRDFSDEGVGGLNSMGISTEHGWGIKLRAAFAKSVTERSVTGHDARQRWNRAIEAIGASSLYNHMKVVPQLGLIPIGEDPQSHLYEFAHLGSGAVVDRGPEGQLMLTGESGLVFVLIPGGEFSMGAQATDPSKINFDAQSQPIEGPVLTKRVPAFFLSKFEMTQGQWNQLAGKNPSQYGPGAWDRKWSRSGKAESYLHPVENVSWVDCARVLGRMQLELPTEAQWEYSLRYGDDFPPTAARSVADWKGSVNLADRFGHENGMLWQSGQWEPDLDDGNAVHAEVGSYSPNQLGLHDMRGNVWEWCQDTLSPYAVPDRQDVTTTRQVLRVRRGGSFDDLGTSTRAGARHGSSPTNVSATFGVRPARELSTLP